MADFATFGGPSAYGDGAVWIAGQLYWCNGVTLSAPISLEALGDIGDYKYRAVQIETDNWKLCNGQAISRTTYADLFTLVGTAFGVGNGTTTFNLPDAYGRAIGCSGQGTGLTNRPIGTKVGAETHTLNINEMPAHTHSEVQPNTWKTLGSGLDSGMCNTGTGTSGSTGGGQAHNNMQPTVFAGFLFIKVL